MGSSWAKARKHQPPYMGFSDPRLPSASPLLPNSPVTARGWSAWVSGLRMGCRGPERSEGGLDHSAGMAGSGQVSSSRPWHHPPDAPVAVPPFPVARSHRSWMAEPPPLLAPQLLTQHAHCVQPGVLPGGVVGHAGVGARVLRLQALQHQAAAVHVEAAGGRSAEGQHVRVCRCCLGPRVGPGQALPEVGAYALVQWATVLQPGHVGRRMPVHLAVQPHLLTLQDTVLLAGTRAPDLGGLCGRHCGEAWGLVWAGTGAGHIGGAGRRPTEHGHHKVLPGLGLGVLGHTRVGPSLGRLHATQLEAAPAGDHAVRHAALWGVQRRARPSPAPTRPLPQVPPLGPDTTVS